MGNARHSSYFLSAAFLLQLALASCNSSNDPSALESQLTNFSAALAKGDTATLRSLCTTDFVLLDEGKIYDLNQLFASMKTVLDSNSMTRKPVDPKITMRDESAWAYYKVSGELRTKTQTIPISLLESVVLDKTDGVWKIAQVSTMPISNQ